MSTFNSKCDQCDHVGVTHKVREVEGDSQLCTNCKNTQQQEVKAKLAAGAESTCRVCAKPLPHGLDYITGCYVLGKIGVCYGCFGQRVNKLTSLAETTSPATLLVPLARRRVTGEDPLDFDPRHPTKNAEMDLAMDVLTQNQIVKIEDWERAANNRRSGNYHWDRDLPQQPIPFKDLASWEQFAMVIKAYPHDNPWEMIEELLKEED